LNFNQKIPPGISPEGWKKEDWITNWLS